MRGDPLHSWAFAGAALLILPALASWRTLVGLFLRPLAFVLGAVALSLGFAYLVAVKSSKRAPYQPPAPFICATPAAWASQKVKHEWATRRMTAFEPLHSDMPAELVAATDAFFTSIISAFVSKWLDEITGSGASQAFPSAVERLLRTAFSRIIARAEQVDWASFLVNTLVPRLTNHLDQFHDAELKLRGSAKTGEADEMDLLLANLYAGSSIRLHPAVDVVSYNTRPSEEAHLRHLVEKLLPLLLPESESGSVATSIMAREIVACTISLPLIAKIADPDFWNRLIEDKAGAAVREQKMVRELRQALDAAPPTRSRSLRNKHASGPAISAESGGKDFESFLRSIKRCATVGEARRLRNDVDVNIRRTQLALTSTGDPTESDARRRTAELTVYLERLILARDRLKQRLHELGDTANSDAPARPADSKARLIDILQQPEALPLFMEFMERRKQLNVVEFYLTVEGLRNPLDDLAGANKSEADLKALLDDARMMWESYFAKGQLHFAGGDMDVLRQTAQSANLEVHEAARIRSCFASLQRAAMHEMEDYHFEAFQRSDLFLKATAALRPSQKPSRPPLMARAASHPGPMPNHPTVPTSTAFAPVVALAKSQLSRTETAPPQVTFLPAFESPSQNGTTTSVKESLDFLMGSPAAETDAQRAPLFGDVDGADEDEHNVDYVQVQTIEAIQEALNTILETDRRAPKSSSGRQPSAIVDRRTTSAALPGKKASANSVRSPSSASARPVTVSNPLPHRKRIFADDDELQDEDGDGMVDASDEENQSLASSSLLTPGRLVSEAELKAESNKLEERAEALQGQEEVMDAMIRKADLTGNTRELKILHKSLHALQRELRGIEFQQAQIKEQAAEHRLVPGRVSISISGTTVSEAAGKSFVLYLVEVHQLDEQGKPVRGWMVTRRYSEFDALDRALRERLPTFRPPELPSKRLVSTLSGTSVEARRKGLERYLQAIVRVSTACSSAELRTFLSQGNLTLPSLDDAINRRMVAFLPGQSIVRSFVRSVATGIDDIFSGPSLIDAVIQRLSQQASGAPVQDEDLASSAHLSALTPTPLPKTEASDAVTSFTAPLADFFVELFGLEAANNWLRRQAILIVMQQVLGGTIEKRLREAVKTALAPANFVLGINMLRDQLFADPPPPPQPARTVEQKAASREAAAQALAALMPAMAASLIGRSNSRRAARNIFAILQSARLNRHLLYCVLDDVMRVLFGDAVAKK